MGIPVRVSFPFLMVSPASASPRKPCSGANTFFICICAASRVSNRWVSPTLEVWFTTNATRFPFNIGKRRPICSAPVITFCAVTALQINKRQYRKMYFVFMICGDYFVILHKNKNLIENGRTCYH